MASRPMDVAPPMPDPSGCGLRLWQMMVAVALVALFLWSVIGFLAAVLILGILMGPSLVAAPIIVFVTRRTTRQGALLELLAAAAEQEVPPGPAIAAFADLCGGAYRRKLLAVTFYLDRGLALPDALDREPGTIPPGASGLLRVGWASGAPSRALRDLAAAGSSWRPHRQALVKALAYALAMMLALQLIAGFLAYFIAPKFAMIFQDYGIPLPPLTRFVVASGGWLVRIWPLTLAAVLLELMMAGLLFTLLVQYVGGPELRLPPFHRLARRRHAATIFRALAMVIDAGKPISEGFVTLARYHPRAWVRSRLSRVGQRVAAGEDWIHGLRAERLIRASDAVVLDSALRAGNLPWALRELAEGTERRLNYRLQAWSQFLVPAVVLAVGTMVALLAMAYFLPLITLIEGLAR